MVELNMTCNSLANPGDCNYTGITKARGSNCLGENFVTESLNIPEVFPVLGIILIKRLPIRSQTQEAKEKFMSTFLLILLRNIKVQVL